jgi:hypothetical protein
MNSVRPSGPPISNWSGHVDAPHFPTVLVIDPHLSVGDVQFAVGPARHAFPAARGDDAEVGKRTAGRDPAAIGQVFRGIGQVHALTRVSGHQPIAVERIRPAPALMIVRSLVPDPERRDRDGAIGRDIGLTLCLTHLAGEEVGKWREFIRLLVDAIGELAICPHIDR